MILQQLIEKEKQQNKTCKIFHDLFAEYRDRDNNEIKKSNTNETESEEKEVDGKKKLKRVEEYFYKNFRKGRF